MALMKDSLKSRDLEEESECSCKKLEEINHFGERAASAHKALGDRGGTATCMAGQE
jgi:hypothetical protein